MNRNIQSLIDLKSQHQIAVNTLDYIAFLTRLGITLTTDIQVWLESHGDLYFFTAYQGLVFTKALMFGDFETLVYNYGSYSASSCKNEITGFDAQTWQRVEYRIELYLNWFKITQWDVLKQYVLNNDMSTQSQSIQDVKNLLSHYNKCLIDFKQELAENTISNILQAE